MTMKDDLILGGAGGLMGGGKTPKTTPDTLHSEDTVEFTLAISEGPIGGLLNGPKTFYLSGTPAMSPSGESNFTPFQLDIYHGDPLASVIHNELGGTSSSTSVNVALAANTPVTRTTSSTLRTKLDVLEVRLQINQLVQSNARGDQLEETAQFKIQYRRAGQTVWLNFFADEIISLTGKTTGGAVKEFRKKVPRINNDWEIRVTKISADNVPYHLVAITWESFQCVTSEDRAYDDLAVVKGIAKASDQFSSIPEFSGVYAGKLVLIPNNYNPLTRHYTGVWDGTFVLGHTDNPAWVTYDILMNPKYGMKRHFPQLLCDRFTFYEGARWCDQLVPRGTTGTFQPRYTYNDVLSEPRPGIEHARYVAGCFGAVITSDMNKTLRLKTDMPASFVQVFGPESVTPDLFSYQFSDITQRVNDVTISFVNPDLEWDQDVRQVKDDAYIALNGRIPSEPIAVGCIDPYEAQRRAYNMLLKANTEITTVSFQTARQSLALEVFDVVGIADPVMNWGLSGRVKSVDGQVITLRDFLQLPVATDITMHVQTPTGIVPLTVRTSSANTKSLVIQGAGVYPANAPSRAQFTLSATAVGLVKPFRVMSITPDTANQDIFSITALEMNTNRYADADNLVSSGTVNYQGVFSSVPTAPTITILSSGLAHQVVAEDGTITSRIAVELSLPAGLAGVVEIFYRRQGIDSYQSVQLKGREGYITNVQVGITYDVYAVMVAQDGRRGPPSSVMTHTVLGRAVTVTTPTPWTAVSGFDTVTLNGLAHPDADFSAFKVYGATAASATPIYLDTVTSTKYVRRPPVGDAFTRYKISALNRSGIESAMTAFVAAVPTPPAIVDMAPSVGTTISGISAVADGALAAAGVAQGQLNQLTNGLVTGLDGALSKIEARAAAGLNGWLADPIFARWTSGNLTASNWFSRSGTATYCTSVSGAYGAAMSVNGPSGTQAITVLANSATGMNGGNAQASHLVLSMEFEYISGDPAGAAIRLDWSNDGVTWTAGNMLGLTAPPGYLTSYGITPAPGVRQVKQVLVARPAGTFSLVRLVFQPKLTGNATAQNQIWHLLNVRAATEAEIRAGNVPGMQTSIANHEYALTDPAGALALSQSTLNASIAGVQGQVTSIKAVDISALTGTAFGTLLTQLGVSAGGVSSFVTTNGAAVASLEGNAAAAYSLRVGAGGAAAGFEIVASDDVVAGAASTIKLSAKHLEIFASTLRLSDRANQFPDFDLLDPDFSFSSTGSPYTFVGTSGVLLGRRYVNMPAAAVEQKWESGWFGVEPSTEYLLTNVLWMGAAGAGGGSATLSCVLGTVDANGVITAASSTTISTVTDRAYPTAATQTSILTTSSTRRMRFVMTRAAGGTVPSCVGGLKVQKKSGATLILDGSMSARHVRSGSMSADDIKTGTMDAKNLTVTQLLKISTGTGALSVGKNSAFDLANDGIFFGRTVEYGGAYGFGLLAGKKVGGVDQYIQATAQSGLKLVNAAHFVTGIAAPTVIDIATSQTITLPVGTKYINLEAIGGGGGGAGATGNSGSGPIAAGNGGSTSIQLWNGAVNTGISWTSAGGAGATNIHAADGGNPGQGSELGAGGIPSGNWGIAGGTATGYGAGGGGGAGTEKGGDGGLASLLISVENYDVSALANPKLVIVVGAAGVGSIGQGTASAGGNGSPGIAKYSARSTAMVAASVLPLQPTFSGTVTKAAAAALVFPAYGAGLWCLSAQGTAGLLLDYVETHLSGARVRLVQGNYASFVSDKTPVDLAVSATAVTYDYQFYKLGAWV